MSTSQRRILVTAATGRQGAAVTHALLERDWLVRALVRDPTSPAAAALAAAGAEIAVGDFDDAGSVAAALDGVHGVFLYQPGFMSPELTPGLGPASELTRGRAALAAAVKAGVGHLVYSSALGADSGLSPLLAPKAALEAELGESGLPATIIRPVGFMENYAGPGRGLQPHGTIRTPAPPNVIEQLIAVRDIGVFAALAFADPDRYVGEAFELAGDELTVPEIADAISGALGRRVRYSQIPIAEIRRVDPVRAGSLERLYSQQPPRADIRALREAHPGLCDFRNWLESGGAQQIDAYLQPGR